MKLHDVIKIKEDIPEENLKKGMTGVIVAILREPCLAYEVEFCDKNGQTVTETALLPKQVGLVRQMIGMHCLQSSVISPEEKIYQKQMSEDHSDTNAGRKEFLIPVDELLACRLTEIAESKQIPPETLIELWLKEKISESYQQA